MGRKKQTEEIELNAAPDREDTQILNRAELESEEAELLTDEANAEADAEVENGEAKPKRRSRARKTEEPVAEIEEIAAAPELETPEIEDVPAPQRRSRSRAKKEDTTPVTGETLAAKNMEEISKQWTLLFERLNSVIPKPAPVTDTSEFPRPVKDSEAVPFITKFAIGSSLVATLLSVLSLSLSQSARNSALNQEIAFRQQIQASVHTAAPADSTSHEIAAANASSPRRSREGFFKMKK